MLHELELWADRNFKEVMIFLVGAMCGGCLAIIVRVLTERCGG